MKINLGSGFKRIPGFVNVDFDEKTNPDYAVNLDDVNIKLPFDNDTVDEVVAHHILEHIGEGLIPLLKELYRVCCNDAIIDIVVPHHLHDIFWGDLTHKRPITVSAMTQLSKSFNKNHSAQFNSSSGLAVQHNFDFEMIWYDFEYDAFYHDMIKNHRERKEKNETTPEENWAFERLFREATNVAITTKMKLRVNKDE